MNIIVQKFGGTSMGSIERIRNVAQIVAKAMSADQKVIVVVSAMSGETDRLLGLANQLGKNERELDAIVATGEQVASCLLAMALCDINVPAKSLNGWQLPLRTSKHHQRARIQNVDIKTLLDSLQANIIPVVTGFQGVNEDNEITTLGRGGSDLTAVAIANAVGATECQIFTDVDGVYTCDPRVVPNAQRLHEVSFDEMMELASQGSKVLQDRSLEYAGKYEVPVRVLSSMQPGEGTLVTFNKNRSPDAPLIAGVALAREQAQISLCGMPQRPGLASYILSAIGNANIDVDMIVQNLKSEDQTSDFSFIIHRRDFDAAYKIAETLVKDLRAEKIVTSNQLAKLSLVGIGMRSHAGIASKMFSALGQEGIDVLLISATELKITAVIDERFLEIGARTLHQAFDLDLPPEAP